MSYVKSTKSMSPDDLEYGYISEIIADFDFEGNVKFWFVKYKLQNNQDFNFMIKIDGSIANMKPGAL